MNESLPKVIKKRKYSRNGCLECKKRKIKCDETKPVCQNCYKSRKTCHFPDTMSQSRPEVSSDSNLSLIMNPSPVPEHSNKLSHSSSSMGNNNTNGNVNITSYGNHPPSSSTGIDSNYMSLPISNSSHNNIPTPTIPSFGSLSGSLRGSFSGPSMDNGLILPPPSGTKFPPPSMIHPFDGNITTSNSSQVSVGGINGGVTGLNENGNNVLTIGVGVGPVGMGNMINHSITGNNSIPTLSPSDKSISDELFSGASMLAHDLNDLLSGKFTNIPDNVLKSFSENFDHSIQSQIQPTPPPSVKFNDEVFDDAPLIAFINSFDHLENNQKNYLKIFYEKYSLWLMPLAPVSGPKNFFNKIIIQQAQKVPFLLHAIFSISASFEYEESKSPADDYYKRSYTGLSLKGLNSVFSHKSKVSEYIEPLILTSLLFVTDAASTINGSWRAHLKGANDLFRQYLTLCKKNSPSILLATTWFASFEIIAVITNPVGGSINNPNQLNDILSPILYRDDWNLAIQLGFVLPNGYNVFLGQSSANVTLFIHFLKLSIKLRNSEKQTIDSNELVVLFQLFDIALSFSLASPDGIIEPSSPYYPQTGGMTYLPPETYGYKNDLVFSWFDLSDKIHIRGLYLTALTNPMYLNLNNDSKIVQDVVQKIINMCYFFHGIHFELPRENFNFDEVIRNNKILHDRRLLMLHSSLLICGLCCIDELDRLKIELYFKSLISLGARTVENSYNRLLSHWSGDTSNLDFVPYL